MASKTTLNAGNLEELGTSRLAELLIEVIEGNASAKRHIRQHLQLKHNPKAAIMGLRKRLTTLSRSRSRLDARKARALHEELSRMIRFIVEGLALANPAEGFDLMWRIYDLCDWVDGRTDFYYHDRFNVRPAALAALGKLAVDGKVPPSGLADRVFEHLVQEHFGPDSNLLSTFKPALGKEGFGTLRERMFSHALQQRAKPVPEDERGAESERKTFAHARDAIMQERHGRLRHCLMQIAQLENDADAYIALVDEPDREKPLFARRIARILLRAGRADEAWGFIEQTEGTPLEGRAVDYEWADVKIDALVALGRSDVAQEIRLHCFKQELRRVYLKDYLENLPGFEDIEAEEKWLDYAMDRPSHHEALSFLIRWPSYERASRLIVRLNSKLKRVDRFLLKDAAELMWTRYPLAATLACRAMVEQIVDRFPGELADAAKFLNEYAGEVNIKEFGEFETHEEFLSRLRDSLWEGNRFCGMVKAGRIC